MHKNEEIGEAKSSGGAGEVEAKIADLATKTELSTKADKAEVEAKIAGLATKADLNTKADNANYGLADEKRVGNGRFFAL